MITTDPGKVVSLSVSTGVTGQVGLLAVQVVLPGSGSIAVARTTAGISEFPAGSGVYGVEITAPLDPGLFMVVWDTAGVTPLSPANTFTEQMAVNFQPAHFYDEVVWFGGGGNVLPGDTVSDASAGSNPIPDAAAVRASSNLAWADYGDGLGDDAGAGGLQEVVDRAESAFFNITGQTLDSIDVKFAPQVRRVIQAMTETIAMQQSSDVLDTTADWDLISSFSAGPYSESHRSPQDMLAGRMLWPVPWVSAALWALLTPDRYAFWLSWFTGTNQPAFEGTDVFWEEGQVLSGLMGPPGYGGFFFGA